MPAPSRDGLVSADGSAHVEPFVTGTGNHWVATTTLAEPHELVWQARFGEHAPPHLITAFTRALAHPSPLPARALP